MKWIKTSDRLPDKLDFYITRLANQTYNNCAILYFNKHTSFNPDVKILDREWLEELNVPYKNELLVFIPCDEHDERLCGGFTSIDGQRLCYVREVEDGLPEVSDVRKRYESYIQDKDNAIGELKTKLIAYMAENHELIKKNNELNREIHELKIELQKPI